jgi:hypothetical protein
VPEIGSNLLKRIPRLEQVAEAIFYMNKNFNGTGFPADGLKGVEIPMGGRILRVTTDYLSLLATKGDPKLAVAEMEFRTSWYDLAVLHSLSKVLKAAAPVAAETEIRELNVKELRLGHLLDGDIETVTGLLLVPAGTRLGLTHLEKLRNFARLGGIREPIRVVVQLD